MAGFRHVVLFSWRPDVTDHVVRETRTAIEDFAATVRDLCTVWVAENAGEDPSNYDMAVIADFADASGYRAYAGHPMHLALLERHIRPNLAGRAAVQAPIRESAQRALDGPSADPATQ